MQAIEGIYRDGHIKLLEMPREVSQARVIVTFLDAEDGGSINRESVADLSEILDEDMGTSRD